jgi:hypothetical protein
MNLKAVEMVCRLQKIAAVASSSVADMQAALAALRNSAGQLPGEAKYLLPSAGRRRGLGEVLSEYVTPAGAVAIGSTAALGAGSAGYQIKSLLDRKLITPEQAKEMEQAALKQGMATPQVPGVDASGWNPALNVALPAAGVAGGGALGNYIGGQYGSRTLGTILGGAGGGGMLYLLAKELERRANKNASPNTRSALNDTQTAIADKDKPASAPITKADVSAAKNAVK